MTLSRKEERRLRELIRLGTGDALREFKKDILRMCMTREDCLSIHQGRHTNGEVNGNGNGGLKKQKAIFWSKLVGLITVLTTLGSLLILWLSGRV